MRVGLLHPGEMGAAIGAMLVEHGHVVLWRPQGRSEQTARRAAAAGLTAVEDFSDAEVILSVCPPHAALEVARSLQGTAALVIDANAVSPQTARRVGELFDGRWVDGASWVLRHIAREPPASTCRGCARSRRRCCLRGLASSRSCWMARAAESAAAKGWRWVGEMNEIAATFAAAGLPSGFHEAAAEMFERATED